MSIHYCIESLWVIALVLSVNFWVLRLRTSLQKAPYYYFSYYVIVIYWKATYYFILHQVNLLFVTVSIIFLRKRWYLVQILILCMNLPTSLFSIHFHSQYLILITITNISISAKLHPNHSLLISGASTEEPSNNGGQLIIVSKVIILL